jgi:hypothetical protein
MPLIMVRHGEVDAFGRGPISSACLEKERGEGRGRLLIKLGKRDGVVVAMCRWTYDGAELFRKHAIACDRIFMIIQDLLSMARMDSLKDDDISTLEELPIRR